MKNTEGDGKITNIKEKYVQTLQDIYMIHYLGWQVPHSPAINLLDLTHSIVLQARVKYVHTHLIM